MVNKLEELKLQAPWVNYLIMVSFDKEREPRKEVFYLYCLYINKKGCDALNTTLGVITWASSTYLGQSWWTVASLAASLANFYLSTWEEYHTGILFLGHFSGPVEGVLMLCGVHLISGFFGPAIWVLRVSELFPSNIYNYNDFTKIFGALQLNHVLIVFGAVVTFSNIITG